MSDAAAADADADVGKDGQGQQDQQQQGEGQQQLALDGQRQAANGADAGKDAGKDAGQADKGQQQADWRAGVQDPELKTFAQQFTSVEALAKSAKEGRQLASKAIVPPGENATDEDRARFAKALGVPEKPEAYSLNLPEEYKAAAADPNNMFGQSIQHFQQAFHKAQLTPHQAQILTDAHFALERSNMQALVKADETFAKETETALRAEWGLDYDRNKTLAGRLATTAVSENALTSDEHSRLQKLETKDGRFVLDHPMVLKLFSWAMRKQAEDQPGILTMGEDEAEASTAKLEEMRGEVRKLATAGKHKEARAMQEKVDRMDKQLFGAQPAIGREGRTA